MAGIRVIRKAAGDVVCLLPGQLTDDTLRVRGLRMLRKKTRNDFRKKINPLEQLAAPRRGGCENQPRKKRGGDETVAVIDEAEMKERTVFPDLIEENFIALPLGESGNLLLRDPLEYPFIAVDERAGEAVRRVEIHDLGDPAV